MTSNIHSHSYLNFSLLVRIVDIVQKIKPTRFNLHLVELWNRGKCWQFPRYPIMIVDLRTVICCTTPLITITTVRTGKSGTRSQRSAGWKLFSCLFSPFDPKFNFEEWNTAKFIIMLVHITCVTTRDVYCSADDILYQCKGDRNNVTR